MGEWHKKVQAMFPVDEREVRFVISEPNVSKRHRIADACTNGNVIEFQHSHITFGEVQRRNEDYGNHATTNPVVWIIDCTENLKRPQRLSDEKNDEEELWMLEFEKNWHVDSMKSCTVLFADFGERIFRIPIDHVRHRIVLAFGSWTWGDEFVAHLASDEFRHPRVPEQSTLTVAQDPHGSGKTYGIAMKMLHAKDAWDAKYDTFIVVAKAHSAKEVVKAEFMHHLRRSGFAHEESRPDGKKYVVTFTRPCGKTITCIFGTVDSLMYNLSDNKIQGADLFTSLVRTIQKYGANKLRGPNGRFRYATETPCLNGKTLVIVDEATMIPESYLHAFATLMRTCSVDIHLAGDVQQSTMYEENVLSKTISEFNDNPASQLPSFPTCKVRIQKGNEVRRFNQTLVNFRNAVMQDFHEKPSHNLGIPIPVAASDVPHARGEFGVHVFKKNPIGLPEEKQHLDLQENAQLVMDHLDRDVRAMCLLPNDILIVTPFVKHNPIMDVLQTMIHEFWAQRLQDDEYLAAIRMHPESHDFFHHQEKMRADGNQLSWTCVMHRSEEGKPIDTTESEYATRIVSIHAAQGDGRKLAYVIGLSESALKRFSAGRCNIKYESLLNVSISRMKEAVRVFLLPCADDISKRFKPFIDQFEIPQLHKHDKRPFNLVKDADIDKLDDEVFQQLKCALQPPDMDTNATAHPPANTVDHAHHIIRMATANTVIWASVLVHFGSVGQVYQVFQGIANADIESLKSKEYFRAKKEKNKTCIPVLVYDTGDARFSQTHRRIIELIRTVQSHAREWIKGRMTDMSKLGLDHMIVLEYAVQMFTRSQWGTDTLKADHLYDIVGACARHPDNKLVAHYARVKNCHELFNQVKSIKPDMSQWIIERSITLGSKVTHKQTQYFACKATIHHICMIGEQAMIVQVCPRIDDLSIKEICKIAMIHTLMCSQPCIGEAETILGKPTSEYVAGKEILVCMLPIGDESKPIITNITPIVEKYIGRITDWILDIIKERAVLQMEQDVEMGHDMKNARIRVAEKKNDFYPYLLDALNEADTIDELRDILGRNLKMRMKTFARELQER